MIWKYLSDRSFIKTLLSESIQERAGLELHSGFPCLREALPGSHLASEKQRFGVQAWGKRQKTMVVPKVW